MAHIDIFACATCNRPYMLNRCLSSYLEGRFAPETEILVIDDSHSASMRQRTRAVAVDLNRRFRVEISYAGFEEKAIYAKRLMNVVGSAAASIKFALFGSGVGGTSIGSSRNALLLQTVGGLGVTVDDDILCQLYGAPKEDAVADVASPAAPARAVWSFENRDVLLWSLAPVGEPFLALHERFLGTAVGKGSDGAGTIAVTLTGFAGDCTWDSPAPLFFTSDATFERLVSSERAYSIALASREQLQVTPSLRITSSGEEVMAGCMGLDFRTICPPFVPNGRGEDALFGATLAACLPNARIAHLPVAVLHAPEHARAFASVDSFRRHLTVLMLVSACMSTCEFGATQAIGQRLLALGRHLQSIGDGPVRRLMEQILQAARVHWGRLLQTLELRLNSRPRPAYWIRDAQSMMRAIHAAIADDNPLTPVEFGAGTVEDGYERGKLFVRKLGDLFVAWPEIVEAGRALRRDGVRLASAAKSN